MALKDWKKYRKNTWYNKENGKIELLFDEERNKYHVRTFISINKIPPKYSKLFKTKSQALKFVKAYMRKH